MADAGHGLDDGGLAQLAAQLFISVARTVWVNGPMRSSHTFSSSSSAGTTAPPARSSSAGTPNSLRVSDSGRPFRKTSRRAGSSVMPARRSGGGQHQHPHVRPGRHHRPAHVVAVHHRQVAVQHQHVVVVDAQPLQRGVSASSRADLTAALERLGADLLTVAAGDDVFGEEPPLPAESIPMIGRRPAQPYRLSS